ncbi:MAG: DNA polymerase III subunit alpha [Rickettsiaceae bacterium]
MTKFTDKFVHFRAQSSYSMLESAIKITDLISITKKCGMSAVCLSDRGNLFGSLEFSLAAIKAGIQPICGAILNISFSHKKLQQDFAEILIIAKDKVGYKNLLKLVSYSFIKNDRVVSNHITFEDLKECNDGLIILSAYTKGIIGKLLLNGSYAEAIQKTKKLISIFGNRFYFEIMRHNLADEKQIEPEYLKIASEFSIPLIATNQVLFGDIKMHDAHDILLCISQGVVKDEQNRSRVSNQCYFKSSDEMIELFADLPEAIENTVNLVKRIYIMAEAKEPSLPNFTDGSISEEDLIKQESQKGLEKKLAIRFALENISKTEESIIRTEYFARLEYELEIICKMNFPGYFLIVSDFIRWSKENVIAVGPGRGSGAGSIVAWCLQITDLDPMKFGLLFERFLNPERISMPDFDIDFCQERREEVIAYVRKKYGEGRVGQIITFGKLQAKAVIKDVSRVLGLSYTIADYLTELVPFNAVNPVTLNQAINDVAELRDAAKGNGLYNLSGDNELIKHVLEAALVLEGLHRHSSTHAAGIVIANEDMIESVPLYRDNNSNMLIVQYSMKYCELSGLIKFDFLGLQTLTVITKCLELLKQQDINIDLDKLSFDDEKTFEMLSKGVGTGVFQFESAGMKSALRKLRPDNIGDIIALGALYRPGPMDNIPAFIACKHGQQEADYLHPLLMPILKSTYGIIIYQEQVLEIARKLSGYSLGSADLLRRAMGKKVKSEMDAQEEIFVSGAVKNNVPVEQARSIFAKVAKFAGYGFNKAHASAYGVISYQTAFLKANFPTEFLVAAMNLDIDNSDKINIFLQEAKIFDIKIVSPSINESYGYFRIKKNEDGSRSIIFALAAIKSVTVNFGEEIAKIRNENGEFKSIIDFIERTSPKLINRKLLENTIKAGCFDSLHANRNSLLLSVQKLMAYSLSYHTEKHSSQFSLIKVNQASNDVIVSNQEELGEKELAYQEFEVMGLFLEKHPLSCYVSIFETYNIKNSVYIKNDLAEGSHLLKFAGVIIKKDTRMSGRGRFITIILSDPLGVIEVTIFNEEIMREYAHLLSVKVPVVVTCDVLIDKGGARITARSFSSIEDVFKNVTHDLKLFPKNKNDLIRLIDILENKINQEQSNSLISIFCDIEEGFIAKISLPEKFWLDSNDILQLEPFK